MVGAIGRAGYLVTPNVLLYGLGGLELGHFTYPDSNDRFGGKNGKWVAGYTVGAGGEVKLTDNWSLRGEYRYLHFGESERGKHLLANFGAGRNHRHICAQRCHRTRNPCRPPPRQDRLGLQVLLLRLGPVLNQTCIGGVDRMPRGSIERFEAT